LIQPVDQNKRQKIMKQLSNLLIALSVAVVANLSYSQEMITLTTDKNNYRATDKFVVNIVNQSEHQAAYYRLSVQQQVNQKWIFIRADTGCPCRSKCKKSPIELPPGKVITETWDMKDNQCAQATSGKYRLVLLGGWDSIKKTNRTMAESSSFYIE
jgi:hypothetical protein